MKIYIIPKEYVESSKIDKGEYAGYWELPEKNGHKDYSIATGWVRATWSQHIYHTAHVSLTAHAARRIRAALARGDSLVYRDGPQHADKYILYQAPADACGHCASQAIRIN